MEDIRLVREKGEGLTKAPEGYRYTQGCFFKHLTALKRPRRS